MCALRKFGGAYQAILTRSGGEEVHFSTLIRDYGVTVTTTFCEVPLYKAMIVTPWFWLTLPALILKVRELELALTVTDAGRLNSLELANSVTTMPPAGAAVESVTVQDVLVPEANVVGEHENLETDTLATTSDKVVVLDAKFRVAVTVADWFVEMVPVVALN